LIPSRFPGVRMLCFSDSPVLNPDLSPVPPAMGVGGVEVGFVARRLAVTPTPPREFVVGVSIAGSSRECSIEPASPAFPRSSG